MICKSCYHFKKVCTCPDCFDSSIDIPCVINEMLQDSVILESKRGIIDKIKSSKNKSYNIYTADYGPRELSDNVCWQTIIEMINDAKNIYVKRI